MKELIAAAGDADVTARFVRFLVSEGVIPPPSGGRAHADYDERHLEGARTYLRLRARGFSASQAKAMVRGARGETVPLPIVPGLALHVDLAAFDPTADPALVLRRAEEAVRELLSLLKPEGSQDDERA